VAEGRHQLGVAGRKRLAGRVYYSATSERLLSVDTAPSGDARHSHLFLIPWARVRWAGIMAIVGIFVLIAGISYVLTGNPTRRVDSSVAGVVSPVVAGILVGASIVRLVRRVQGRSTS